MHKTNLLRVCFEKNAPLLHILSKNVKGHNISHVKQQDRRDFRKKERHRWRHWRETHPQRGDGGCHHIGLTQSCQHSDRRSFTVSCMKCTQTLITPTVEGLCLCVCVWVRAHESTCLINHWNPPHQSLTNRQHSRLVPEGRIWAKWLN